MRFVISFGFGFLWDIFCFGVIDYFLGFRVLCFWFVFGFVGRFVRKVVLSVDFYKLFGWEGRFGVRVVLSCCLSTISLWDFKKVVSFLAILKLVW